MAKASKPKKKTKKRGNYDEKLAVKGTFADIMNAAVKHRENNTPAKKNEDKRTDLEKKVDAVIHKKKD